ncbi:protein of unknown function [Methylocaldum szegediense]|uniref:Transposase n=1 Tax=Methylocaldum szegediense TaxID=73780 RepID=A0ABM9I9B5_9GAMM|nr:protein of unknown function [Methylocaldum szegediense]
MTRKVKGEQVQWRLLKSRKRSLPQDQDINNLPLHRAIEASLKAAFMEHLAAASWPPSRAIGAG